MKITKKLDQLKEKKSEKRIYGIGQASSLFITIKESFSVKRGQRLKITVRDIMN